MQKEWMLSRGLPWNEEEVSEPSKPCLLCFVNDCQVQLTCDGSKRMAKFRLTAPGTAVPTLQFELPYPLVATLHTDW